MTLEDAIRELEQKSLKTDSIMYSDSGSEIYKINQEFSPGSLVTFGPFSKTTTLYDNMYKVISMVEETPTGWKNDLTQQSSNPKIIRAKLADDPRFLYENFKSDITQTGKGTFVLETHKTKGFLGLPELSFRAEFYLRQDGSLEKIISGVYAGYNNGKKSWAAFHSETKF